MITSEFYVEYHHFKAALADLYAKRSKFSDLVSYSEFRPVEQDQIQLSPSKNQQVFSIGFTWVHDPEGVSAAVREVQKILKKYDYRVNWGTYWHAEADFGLFETFDTDLDDLKKAIDAYPDNKFKNCWIERVLYGEENCPLESNFANSKLASAAHESIPEHVARPET